MPLSEDSCPLDDYYSRASLDGALYKTGPDDQSCQVVGRWSILGNWESAGFDKRRLDAWTLLMVNRPGPHH